MKVTVNNQSKSLNNNETLQKLLTVMGVSDQKGFAVAVNNEVVQKANWSLHKLNENDKILIITATQGG